MICFRIRHLVLMITVTPFLCCGSSLGVTGHQYELVRTSEPVTWLAARDSAQVMGGHLVTIRSEAEQQIVNDLLQPGIRRRDLLARLKAGVRVPEEGTTLLVDYEDAGDSIREHVGGHAVYTFSRWLPFHAEQVARRLYSGDS